MGIVAQILAKLCIFRGWMRDYTAGTMRASRVLILQLSLACAIVLAVRATPRSLTIRPRIQSLPASIYRTMSVSTMNLSLGRDGTATVTEDPGNGATTLFGHWVDSGSQVTVTFDAVEGKPIEPPMVFPTGHDGLQAVTWNHASWGKVDPPPMKKGFKVKQLYWLTTGP